MNKNIKFDDFIFLILLLKNKKVKTKRYRGVLSSIFFFTFDVTISIANIIYLLSIYFATT
jgi:hypothetical protein